MGGDFAQQVAELLTTFQARDAAALPRALFAMYGAREPLMRPTPPEPIRLGKRVVEAPSLPWGHRDERAHGLLAFLALQSADSAFADIVFDAMFDACNDAIARQVQTPLHLQEMFDDGVRRSVIDLEVSEQKIRERYAAEWMYRGFLRRAGMRDVRTMRAAEKYCLLLWRHDVEQALLIADALCEARLESVGPAAAETLRARLMYGQMLAHVEYLDRACEVLGNTQFHHADAPPEWQALGVRLRAFVDLRLGLFEGGLRALDAQRISGVRCARLPLPVAPSSQRTPLIAVCEELRSSIELCGYASCSTLSALCRLAIALAHDGQHDTAKYARQLYEQWTEHAERALGDEAADELAELGRYLSNSGEHREAAAALLRAAASAQRASAPDHKFLHKVQNSLGVAWHHAGEPQRALEVLVPLYARLVVDDRAAAMHVRSNYAAVLQQLERYDDAMQAYEVPAVQSKEPIERQRASLGIVSCLSKLGRDAEALSRAWELFVEMRSTKSLHTEVGAACVSALLKMLLASNDVRAADVQQAMLAEVSERFGADSPSAWLEQHNLGSVLLELGYLADAERIFLTVLPKQQMSFGAHSNYALRTHRSLARLLAVSGRSEEAQAAEAQIAALADHEQRYEVWQQQP